VERERDEDFFLGKKKGGKRNSLSDAFSAKQKIASFFVQLEKKRPQPQCFQSNLKQSRKGGLRKGALVAIAVQKGGESSVRRRLLTFEVEAVWILPFVRKGGGDTVSAWA